MKNAYWLFGTRLSVLADQAHTGGRYDLIEGWFSPGTRTPPHRHSPYAEQLYTLDGSSRSGRAGARSCYAPVTTSSSPPARLTPWLRPATVRGGLWSSPRRGGSPASSSRSVRRTRGVACRRPRARTWTCSSASVPNWETRSLAIPVPCPTKSFGKTRRAGAGARKEAVGRLHPGRPATTMATP